MTSRIIITYQPPLNGGDSHTRLIKKEGPIEVWQNMENGRIEPFISVKLHAITPQVKNFQYTNTNNVVINKKRPVFSPLAKQAMAAHAVGMFLFLLAIIWLTGGKK